MSFLCLWFTGAAAALVPAGGTSAPLRARASSLVGVLSTGDYFSLDVEKGQLTVVPRSHSSSPAVASSACTAVGSTIYTLERNVSKVYLVGFNISSSTHAIRSAHDQLPFYSETLVGFSRGLDWYVDAIPGNGTNAALLVTGPDALQFIHMLNVKPHASKASYVDLLSYGGGTRLVRSVSTFDPARGEEWLQVVYDVSQERTNDAYGSFLKRYDMKAKVPALLDVVEDPGQAAVLAHDDDSGILFTVGWCTGNANASPRRCLFSLDPASLAPKMTQVAQLPPQFQAIMAGVAAILHGRMYVLLGQSSGGSSAVSNDSEASPSLVQLNCTASIHVCARQGDAVDIATDVDWHVVGINLGTGEVKASPLQWLGGANPELLICGVDSK